MAIITISRGTFSGGKELSIRLAEKLGYAYANREELSDQATRLGVPAGRLQMAMLKPPRVYQRLGKERDQYLSCMTMLLCERALKEDLVYYGHTGHLLLPGIPNILRIRVLAEFEYRIRSVMQELRLSREKAKEYVTNVDSDRDKWVKFLYGIDWHDPFHYDLVINLDQTGIENATTALCAMAELPNFKFTPASRKALKNLYLTSKAHFALISDPRTSYAGVKVTANEGVVQVTYLPQYSEVAPHVKEVLADIPEIKEVHTTIAQTSILVLQDKCSLQSEAFTEVIKVAKKWDAAVELMSIASTKGDIGETPEAGQAAYPTPEKRAIDGEYDGGIMDDDKQEAVVDEGISSCLDELQKQGCSGGSSILYGNVDNLVLMLQRHTNYSMVILGDLFLGKQENARIRMKSEMKNQIMEHVNIPVVDASELKQQFKFDKKQLLTSITSLAISIIILIGIFTHQKEVVSFLTGEEFKHLRYLAVILIVLMVPIFAFSYGTFTRQVLKMLRLD